MRSADALAALPSRELADGSVLMVAATARARLTGLAGLPGMPAGRALWLPACRSVHTFGMRFALDLVWLDAAGAVLRIDAGVQRRRLRTCLRARSVVEARAGEGARIAAALAAQGCAPAPPGRPEAGVPPADWALSAGSSAGGWPS